MHVETERKFLIELKDEAVLTTQPGCRILAIRQTYLAPDPVTGAERRVRVITENGKTHYVFTRKEHITSMSRREEEWEISREEYDRLYTEAITELTKTRYAFPYEGHVIEVDVYPREIGGDRLVGCAVMEAELEKEDEELRLPPFLPVIRELTGTGEFSNKKLAKKLR